MKRKKGMIKYKFDLLLMETNYVAACDEFMMEETTLGAVLDKLNAQRKVKVAVHTVPAFLHE